MYAKKILKIKSMVERALCIDQIEASTSPPGISRTFDTLVVPVGREFDNQSLHVDNFDPHVQGDGIFELNPLFDFVLVVSFSCFGFNYTPQGSTSAFFMQQIVKQSTVWHGSCIILKQSEYCGKKIEEKENRSFY